MGAEQGGNAPIRVYPARYSPGKKTPAKEKSSGKELDATGTDYEGGGEQNVPRGGRVFPVFNQFCKNPGSGGADFLEGLFNPADGRVQIVEESVVVERNDADVFRNHKFCFSESHDGA